MSGKSFNTGEPLAFFLTWTTYGTWLPGDARGWNRKHEAGIQPPNPFLVDMAQSKMKETRSIQVVVYSQTERGEQDPNAVLDRGSELSLD